jgi:Tfp pilus assembly protein PilF
MRKAAASVITAAALISAAPASSQDADEAQFGKVHFETSCNEAAQRRFDRAMRYQHSFWYGPAKELFEETLAADPQCGIAYWGIALSLLLNPHAAPPKDNLAAGLAALQKAKDVGAKTQRERDYIDALLVFYTDHDKIPHAQRVQAYLKAAEAVAARYPNDDEAQIEYAITLNVAASPNDKTYANQLKGAAILEPIFQRQPRHPGVAHYLIHLYDYPPIAEKGLDAARRYAEIAPAAPHAQHMPSHIFTRVGYWKDSIAANAASAKAARAGKDFHEQLHAMDYQVYAYLQLARDKEALDIIQEMIALGGYNPNVRAGFYAVAASEARYAVERGDWKMASDLLVRPSKFAFTEALTYFARAVGAARAGNPGAAQADIAKLAELRDALRQQNDAYWAEQVDIQWQVASAWVLNAEGKVDEALKAMSTAADAEDRTEKNVVTPGPIAPARELYGAMLMERGKPQEALAAYEATLAKEPNRLGATIGAAKAAETLGDAATAKRYYCKAVALTEGADTARVEIADARAYVARN